MSWDRSLRTVNVERWDFFYSSSMISLLIQTGLLFNSNLTRMNHSRRGIQTLMECMKKQRKKGSGLKGTVGDGEEYASQWQVRRGG